LHQFLVVAAAAAMFATAVLTAAMTAARISGGVFVCGLVACVTDMAIPVAGFVTVEVVEGLLIVLGHRTSVAVARIVAVVDVAVPSGVAVVPGAGTDEDSSGEPVGTIVAIGSAGVWGVVKVPVGAYGGGSDADGDLGGCYGNTAHESNCEGRESQRLA
jgi:hypothetical protein